MVKLGAKFLTSIQLKFSQLNNHEFCHNVKDCASPIYNYGTPFKATRYYSMPF